MSNRLKRRLNDLGVDPASSKSNESFGLVRGMIFASLMWTNNAEDRYTPPASR